MVDGVGGESGGEIAAQTAVEILQARLSRRTTDAARLIREAIALANKQIWDQAQANPALAGMACVLTVAVVDGDQATIGHVGDSRLYLLRRGEIRKITRDHSPVGAREDAGEISEAEAMRHPRRNEIFRDVGSAPHEPDEEGFIDITADPLRAGRGPADLQRRPVGPGDLAGDPRHWSRRNAADPARRRAGADRRRQPGRGEGQRLGGAGRGRALRRRRASRSRKAPASDAAPASARASAAPEWPVAAPGSRLLGAFASRPAFLLYGVRPRRLPPSPPSDRGCGWLDRGHARRRRPTCCGWEPATAAPPPSPRLWRRPGRGRRWRWRPGDYREALQLRAGVALVSRVPRGAVILPPAGSGVPAVTAQGVDGARIAGFRIAGRRPGAAPGGDPPRRFGGRGGRGGDHAAP